MRVRALGYTKGPRRRLPHPSFDLEASTLTQPSPLEGEG
jgi:hypothetical protein